MVVFLRYVYPSGATLCDQHNAYHIEYCIHVPTTSPTSGKSTLRKFEQETTTTVEIVQEKEPRTTALKQPRVAVVLKQLLLYDTSLRLPQHLR